MRRLCIKISLEKGDLMMEAWTVRTSFGGSLDLMHESRRFAKGEEFVREPSLRNEFLAIPLLFWRDVLQTEFGFLIFVCAESSLEQRRVLISFGCSIEPNLRSNYD
ncbi:hypothetical protein DY000_02005186 [Brassica cretica]|uniref:Uncharacterized protein n=1 Tax=Brassica cretica TaxID=69181 RepID=A0ABQ7C2Y7_BRACR|nr:hypothetical protein DY000_02005186 [Brassica cretica]